MQNFKVSIVVVPVYKEENSIIPFLGRAEKVANREVCDYEIIFCLDPSPDKTYEVIKNQIKKIPILNYYNLSRKFGQPAATMAGIYNCIGDICIVIDVDLQNSPELIPEMIKKWQEGFNVVYAKRKSRKGECYEPQKPATRLSKLKPTD